MSEQKLFSDPRSSCLPARLDDEEDEPGEEPKSAQTPPGVGALIQRKFLDARKIFLWGAVTDETAKDVCEKLLYLESKDPGKDVTFYINTPGGSITAGVGIDQAATLRRGAQQDGSHGRGHSRHNDGDGRGQQLDRIVNCHARRDGATGCVDVKGDVLARIFRLKVQELLAHVLGRLVGDRAPEENLPRIEELPLNEGAYTGGSLRGLRLLPGVVLLVVEAGGQAGRAGIGKEFLFGHDPANCARPSSVVQRKGTQRLRNSSGICRTFARHGRRLGR